MGQLHELVIAKDQDIKAAIEAFVLEKGWQNVYISGAIGSVYGLEFTTPADSSYPPQVERTLNSANTALATVDIVAQQLANSDLPGILENLDQTLLEGRESINEASDPLQEVSEIDFEGLNRAILDLQKVLENPLGSLVGGFRKN